MFDYTFNNELSKGNIPEAKVEKGKLRLRVQADYDTEKAQFSDCLNRHKFVNLGEELASYSIQ